MTAMLFDFPSPTPPAPKQKKKPVKQGYTGEFLSFWELYPPRFNSSKFLAFKAWNRLEADEQRQAMIAAPMYARSCIGHEERYTYHAASWLNGKFFEGFAPRPACKTAPIAVNWPSVLKIYAATGRWNSQLGPEPHQPGYLGPTI